MALWKRMQQEGAQPSADSCNALLTACLDCQQNERALTVFQEMQTLGEPGGSPDRAWLPCRFVQGVEADFAIAPSSNSSV